MANSLSLLDQGRIGAPKTRPRTGATWGHSFWQYSASLDALFGSEGAPPGSVTAYQNSRGPLESALIRAGQPLIMLTNGGITGESSAEILARAASVVGKKVKPGNVFVFCGSNDPNKGLTSPQTMANIRAMYAICMSIGALMWLFTDPPRGDYTQPKLLQIQATNQLMRDFAAVMPNIRLVDVEKECIDDSSVSTNVNFAPDQSMFLSEGSTFVHFNRKGGSTIGEGILADMLIAEFGVPQGLAGGGAQIGTGTGDQGNILKNPNLLGTGGGKNTGISGQFADETFTTRSGSISGVGSLLTAAQVLAMYPALAPWLKFGGSKGRIQHIALSGNATAADQLQVYNYAGLIPAGNGAWIVRVEVAGVATMGTIDLLKGQFGIGGSQPWGLQMNNQVDLNDGLNSQVFYGVLQSRPIYLNAGTTQSGTSLGVFAQLSLGGVGAIMFRRPMFREIKLQ